MRSSKSILICALVSVLVIIAFVFVVVRGSHKNEEQPVVPSQDLDYAAQQVIENSFLTICNYTIGESSISVAGHYYDGVRLYLCVYSSDDVLANTSKEDFELLSDDLIQSPDIVVAINSVDRPDNAKTRLLIFNTLSDGNLDDVKLTFRKENITASFAIDRTLADVVERSADYEEISLSRIIFGKTSTYFECDIFARIDGASFQAVIGDTIVPVYLINRTDCHYEFLVPYAFDNSSEFVFISNNMHSVELRIPIDFSKAVEGR